jgi:Tfp pilus assembly protein PilX
MTSTPHHLTGERGAALIIAMMATMLLTALGLALMLVTQTETMVASNYRNAGEGLYAADAGVERVVQDLLLVPDWNRVLSGSEQSGFRDGGLGVKTLGDNTQIDLNALTSALQSETDTANLWGSDNPVWRPYAWGPLTNLIPGSATITSQYYVVVWAADDPADGDGNPAADKNGVLTMRAEAFGPNNTHKVIEITAARTTSAEIERGQIAQRGQEELNQRARKAAVQTPGSKVTRMQMGAGGTLATQP